MRRPARPVPAVTAAALLLGLAAMPATAQEGDFVHGHLIPLEEDIVVPPPSLRERAADHALDAWRSLSETATDAAAKAKASVAPVVEDLKDAVRPAVEAAEEALGPTAAAVGDTIGAAAAPALAGVEAGAGRVWSEAEVLAADAREQAGRFATSVAETAAEVRAHPAMQTVAEVGLLWRVAEGAAVTLLVGGMAWRKLRGV